MKRRIVYIFSLFTLASNSILYGNDSISIIYIANCGFLIEIDSNKILVDGLFKYGHNRYSTPDSNTQKLLVSNQPPFNDIDLILVTHIHEDHFDKSRVIECLINIPYAKILCPQQVMDSISEDPFVFERIKPQLFECTPDTFTSQKRYFGDIEIQACRFLHPKEQHKNVHNIAYLISIHDKRPIQQQF